MEDGKEEEEEARVEETKNQEEEGVCEEGNMTTLASSCTRPLVLCNMPGDGEVSRSSPEGSACRLPTMACP